MWTSIFALLIAATSAVSAALIPHAKCDNDAALSRQEAEARYRTHCEGMLFPAIYPPTPAQMECRKLQYQAQCQGASFIQIVPPSAAEMDCRMLEYQTQCDGKQFTAIFPPSKEQARCEQLRKSMQNGSISEGRSVTA